MTVLDAPRVDTIILDETILDDTLKCTGGHEFCGMEATHLLTWCREPVPVCTPYVEIHLPSGVKRGCECGACKSLIADCWRAVPI
jgi:hypothetical protein